MKYILFLASITLVLVSCKERIEGDCSPVKFSKSETSKIDGQKQFKLDTDRKEFWLRGFILNNQLLQDADLKDYQDVFVIDHQKDSQHIVVTFYENDRFDDIELKFNLQAGNCFTSVSLKND